MTGQPKPRKLLDRVRDKLRVKHYSICTEKTYVNWTSDKALQAIVDEGRVVLDDIALGVAGLGAGKAGIVAEPAGEFGDGAAYGWMGHSGHSEGYLLDLDDGGFTASATTSKR